LKKCLGSSKRKEGKGRPESGLRRLESERKPAPLPGRATNGNSK